MCNRTEKKKLNETDEDMSSACQQDMTTVILFDISDFPEPPNNPQDCYPDEDLPPFLRRSQ